jgi:hypothetical protein
MQGLDCPFPSALNAATEATHHHTWRWAQEHGLVRDANSQRQVMTERFTWLVGHFYPWADARELELISDFTSWLFWHDDLCDETTLGEDPLALAHQFDCLLGIFTRRRPPRDEPFDRAFADLRDRFEALAPSWGWFARLVTSIQQYFDGGLWEASNRRQNLVPSVGAFIGMRRFAGGMYIYCDFVELALRAELPLPARQHREVLRLVQITCNVACWHNDLFSLEKELAYGDVHNLVVALAKEQQLALPEARALAVATCNKEVAAFANTVGRLPSFGAETDARLAPYLRGLGALMRGNLDWSLGTERYRRSLDRQEKATHLPPRSPGAFG